MKKEQSLNDLFALTREHSPTQQLVSAENLLNQATATSASLSTGGAFTSTLKSLFTLKAGATALTTSIVIAGLWFMSSGADTTSESNQKGAENNAVATSLTPPQMTTEVATPLTAIEEGVEDIEQAPYFTPADNNTNPEQESYFTPTTQTTTTQATTTQTSEKTAEEQLPVPSLYTIHDLSEEELKRLGIIISTTNFEIRTQDKEVSVSTLPPGAITELQRLGYDTSKNIITVHSAAYIKTATSPSGGLRWVSPGSPIAKILPVILSGMDRRNAKKGVVSVIPQQLSPETTEALEHEDLYDYLLGKQLLSEFPVRNRLIAIHIQFPSEQNTLKDVYVWYKPTSEMLNALPERHREEIREALSPFAHVELSPDRIIEPITTLFYTLKEKRNISINVYNVEGEKVDSSVKSEPHEPGEHNYNFTVEHLGKGIYFVELTTDQKERVMLKLEWISEVITSVQDQAWNKAVSGSLGIELVSPNPAIGSTTVLYSLQTPRKISVKLYRLSGKLARTIIENQKATAGNHETFVDLKGLQSGAYILEIRSDQGEQVTRKIRVQ